MKKRKEETEKKSEGEGKESGRKGELCWKRMKEEIEERTKEVNRGRWQEENARKECDQ